MKQQKLPFRKKPLAVEKVGFKGSKAKVFAYTLDEEYNESFGYQWETYNTTHLRFKKDDIWERRCEVVLGFPLEMLKGKTVLEIGAGAGRFTLPLAKYAKHVISSDMSHAINFNHAHNLSNVTLVKSDLHDLPAFTKKPDIIFVRGVVQHTPDPRATIKRLFDFVDEGGLIIFDVYKKLPNRLFSQKYFLRTFLPKMISHDDFDKFSSKHRRTLYNLANFSNKTGQVPVLGWFFRKTPLYHTENFDVYYKNASRKEREEMFLSHLLDAVYSGYDNPMTFQEILETLAQCGQYPYSYDVTRNIFRCRKQTSKPLKDPTLSKHGIQWKK